MKIILQTDWYGQPEHGGFYQALVKGYYREGGLDVEISQGGPNSLPVQQVVSGKVQFALTRSDDVIVAFRRGIPPIMVGALMQRDPQTIMFHKESGIRGFKDLDKRRIMSVPGSGFDGSRAAILSRNIPTSSARSPRPRCAAGATILRVIAPQRTSASLS